MRSAIRPLITSVVLAFLLLPEAARAQPIPGCTPGLLASGALSLICVPPPGSWNGQLVVFAHGFVPKGEDPSFELPNLDGVPLPLVVQGLGFAFATTTYRDNGLVILEGVDDIRLLLAAFNATHSATRTHIFGVSEGGLVATLLAERSPDAVDSAVAACAPIGNFRLQVNYIGDFRVLFDYYFPGVLPESPIAIPDYVIAQWESFYQGAIVAALRANPSRALELMRVARAAHDPSNFDTVITTALTALRYNILGTNDARLKLGGNPYGNRLTLYLGSSNDLRLNLLVRRFSASPVALQQLRLYETNGDLRVPLVTLHTTLDPAVPFGHELLYLAKVDLFERGRFVPLPVNRYGHCTFTTNELLGSFALAVGLP